MPIYEYQCEDCGEQFEEIVFGDAAPPPCPKCASTRTKKLMSCCRFSTSDSTPAAASRASAPRSGGGCAGCAGGNCSTCG